MNRTYKATETITCPVYGGVIVSQGDVLTADEAIDAAHQFRRSRAVDAGTLIIGPGFMIGRTPPVPRLASAVRELGLTSVAFTEGR